MSVIRPARLAGVAAAAAIGAVLVAAPASAHVTVSSPDARQGAFGKLVFRVPDESQTAGTVRLVVTLPASVPVGSVLARPHPGWTVAVTKIKLAKPVVFDDFSIDEAVRTVSWTARAGQGIGPGGFDEFELSAGPLPKVKTMTFTARQTYSDGTVVDWAQPRRPGQAEPPHPAPRLILAGSGDRPPATGSATPRTDPVARLLGALGLAAGLLAVGRTLVGRRGT
jgi:uncharacterized protein YcnI